MNVLVLLSGPCRAVLDACDAFDVPCHLPCKDIPLPHHAYSPAEYVRIVSDVVFHFGETLPAVPSSKPQALIQLLDDDRWVVDCPDDARFVRIGFGIDTQQVVDLLERLISDGLSLTDDEVIVICISASAEYDYNKVRELMGQLFDRLPIYNSMKGQDDERDQENARAGECG
jgi:hypothetical protein